MNVLLWILGIFAALLIVVLFSQVRLRISYDSSGVSLLLLFWFVRIRFPQSTKEKSATAAKPVENGENKQAGGNDRELLGMLKYVIDAVGKLLKSVRIRDLRVNATVASRDPFQTAMMFGGSAAGVGILLPLIEQNFRLEKRTIRVDADFESGESKITLFAHCSVRVVKLLAIAIVLVYHYLKEQRLKTTRQRKDGNHVHNDGENQRYY